MSLQHKIREAATTAAQAAMTNERARCLWILDEVLRKTEQGLKKKLLSQVELQIATVRLDLTRAIVKAARTLIASGVRPQAKSL